MSIYFENDIALIQQLAAEGWASFHDGSDGIVLQQKTKCTVAALLTGACRQHGGCARHFPRQDLFQIATFFQQGAHTGLTIHGDEDRVRRQGIGFDDACWPVAVHLAHPSM